MKIYSHHNCGSQCKDIPDTTIDKQHQDFDHCDDKVNNNSEINELIYRAKSIRNALKLKEK